MKILLRISLVLMMLGIFNTELFSKDNVDPKIQKKLSEALTQSSTQGRLFYVCFPGNERRDWGAQNLAVYITASEDTKAYFSNDYLGINVVANIKAYKVTSLTTLENTLSWAWEVWTSEQIENLAFQITADKPISVYVMNSKVTSSEGYLAIPVAAWGKDYYHCSWYDFNESFTWASGFVIMAAENNTKVSMKLSSGVDAPVGQTQGKRKIGQSINITLQKGQSYAVIGDGQTRGTFDMSGTNITSTKPIGVVSFHQRCMIPAYIVWNGRDNLLAMIPPTQAWGKRYASIEMARSGQQGDLFRVVASENNTTIRLRWWNIGNNKLIKDQNGIVLNKGEVYEYNHIGASGKGAHEGVKGMSLVEADKPIMVMQYCYSAEWDGSGCAYDPLMFPVSAVEQYTLQTVFQTPQNGAANGGTEFNDNNFNLIAVGDTNDLTRNQELLKSILLDGVPVYTMDAGFLLNKIPETNLFYARVKVGAGTHRVKGITPFGGYIYGFANCDSYGWPAATNYGILAETDTLAPLLSWEGKCGIYKIGVIDDPEYIANPPRKGKDGDDPLQWDQGLSDQPLILENINFTEPYPIDENDIKREDWNGYPIEYRMNWRYEVEDKYKDGFIMYAYQDASLLKNTSVDSLRYEADSLVINPNKIDFKDVRVATTSAPYKVEIESHSDSVITIKKVYLKTNKEFQLVGATSGSLASRGEKFLIDMTYRPTVEWPTLQDEKDMDSLIVETECLRWAWPVEGRGIEPQILVADFNAGLNKSPFSRTAKGGFLIENRGTMDLVITGIKSIKDVNNGNAELVNAGTITNIQDIKNAIGSNFEWTTTGVIDDKGNNNVNFPITVKAKGTIKLTDLFYVPQTVGAHKYNVLFEHNAKAGNTKDLSIWEGSAAQSDVKTHDLVWDYKRVNSDNRNNGLDVDFDGTMITTNGVVNVINKGQSSIRITKISLKNNNGNFRIELSDEVGNRQSKPIFDVLNPIINNDKPNTNFILENINGSGTTIVKIPIVFSPQINNSDEIIDFLEIEYLDEQSKPQTITSTLRGKSFLPTIALEGYTFALSEVDDASKTEVGKVTIKNTHPTRELKIFDVKWENGNSQINKGTTLQQFYDNNWTTAITIPANSTHVLDVNFVARERGETRTIDPTSGNIEVISDAVKADPNDEEDFYPDTTHVTFVEGSGFGVGAFVDGHDFGLNMMCDNPSGTITVTNTSSVQLDVTRVGFSVPDPIFTIVNDVANFTLAPEGTPGDSKAFEIRYDASLVEGLSTANLTFTYMHNNELKTITSVLTGESEREEVTLKFVSPPKPQVPGNWMPGQNVVGEKNDPFRIVIESSNWQKASITGITFEVTYRASWLNGSDNGLLSYKGAGYVTPADWVITQEELDGNVIGGVSYKKMRIVASGSTPISSNGVLVDLSVFLLLPEKMELNPVIENIALHNSRGVCVDPSAVQGNIELEICAQNLRGITSEVTSYSISEISPNPVKASSIDIDFSIGLDGDTKIELVNSAGEIVQVPVDLHTPRGTYQTRIETNNLSNGAYLLRIVSGPYTNTKELIIAK